MKENNIEELKQMLEELYRTQQARLDVGADDLDIREEIAEVEEEIKELQDETIEENSIEEIQSVDNLIKDIERCEYIDAKIGKEDDFQIESILFYLKDYKRVLKENEELKEYLITQNCEINRLNLDKIRLELSQLPDTTEQYKYLKNEYKMRLERTDLENYKSNYISIQKVKDKIEEITQKIKYEENEKVVIQLHKQRKILQELLERRE